MAAAKGEGKLSLAQHVKGGLKQSWADQEAENEPVSIAPVSKPTAPNPNKFEKRGRPEADERPAPRDDGPRRGGGAGGRGGGRAGAGEGKAQGKGGAQPQAAAAKPDRAKLPVPDQAPWRAYIGNLSLDVMEDQVRKFFDGCNVTHLNLVTRGDGSFKGYGFVEFGDKKSLENALLLNEMSLDGKPIKIDVASPDQGEPKAPTTRGRGRGMGRPVAYQRGTAHGPGSERFNREDADVERPKKAAAAAEPVNVAPLAKHDDAAVGGAGYKRLALRKKGDAAAATSLSTAATASSINAKAKKSNPFGEAKPREANLAAAHKEDKFVEKAPTEEEWNQRLEEEDKHKRRRHHEDEEDEHQSRAAQSHGHGHGHGHVAPAKGTPNAGGAAAPAAAGAGAGAAAAKPKAAAAAPKSPALGAAAAPAPAAAAPAAAAAKKGGASKAPWANAQGTGAVTQVQPPPAHAVVIKDGPNANPTGAPAAVIPAKPAAVWGGKKADAKPAAAAPAAAAPAPAPAAAAPAKPTAKAAPPPGMAAAPAPVAVPAATAPAAAAPAAASPTGDDRANWGRDGTDKTRRVWNDAAESRRGGARGGRGGRGRGAAGARGGARGGGAVRRAEPVAAAKADGQKDGAAAAGASKATAKKAPAAPDAGAAEPEVGNQFSVLDDDDDAGAQPEAADE